MANWCSVEAEIVCIDGREAETLYQKLLMDKTEADKRDRGFYIGSNRYFFDSILEVNNDTVTLNGSVKWGFTDDEILKLTNKNHRTNIRQNSPCTQQQREFYYYFLKLISNALEYKAVNRNFFKIRQKSYRTFT